MNFPFYIKADDEFEKYYLRGLIKPEGEETTYPEDLTDEPDVYLPREIDWRTQGLVSSVKNQVLCTLLFVLLTSW